MLAVPDLALQKGVDFVMGLSPGDECQRYYFFMADSLALAIVERAFALACTHGHAPAIEILDLAMMRSERQRALNFEAHGRPFDDWTDEISPFGNLLRAAFGADGATWNAVLQRFAERYKLEEPILDGQEQPPTSHQRKRFTEGTQETCPRRET